MPLTWLESPLVPNQSVVGSIQILTSDMLVSASKERCVGVVFASKKHRQQTTQCFGMLARVGVVGQHTGSCGSCLPCLEFSTRLALADLVDLARVFLPCSWPLAFGPPSPPIPGDTELDT